MIIWNMIWQAHFWTLLLLYEIWMAVMMLMDTSILFRLNGRVHSNWQNIQITQICPLPFQKQKSKSVEVEDAIFKKVVNCPWVLPPALPPRVNLLLSPWSRSCLPTCSPTASARRYDICPSVLVLTTLVWCHSLFFIISSLRLVRWWMFPPRPAFCEWFLIGFKDLDLKVFGELFGIFFSTIGVLEMLEERRFWPQLLTFTVELSAVDTLRRQGEKRRSGA